jgi:DNA-binding response OmpR family regulator
LIVEDEQKIAAYVKRGLEEQGYAVDVTHTGCDALDWLQVVTFDLIVLDVLLPGLDGLSVCREARRMGVRTPVLMLTARDAIDDRVAGLDAGADDYLVKPFAVKELLARLRALSRRNVEGLRSPVLCVSDLMLDTATHRVTRGTKSIDLTAKEYAVLECLLREPGRLLSRKFIAEHVWSYDYDHESNVIDVYIRNLRRKIDDGQTIKLIHTVRGAGYRLAEDNDALA